MQTIDNIPELSEAIWDFATKHASKLDETQLRLFKKAVSFSSPVDKFVFVAETLYATQAYVEDTEVKVAAQTLVAQCALFCAHHGWHGMFIRGVQISLAMRRELQEQPSDPAGWPSAESDPFPQPTWDAMYTPQQTDNGPNVHVPE